MRVHLDAPRGGDRQREAHGAPRAELALGPDPAAVRVHDALADVEAQAEPAAILEGGLPESLEDQAELVLGDPAARVGDGEEHLVVGDARLDRDAPAARRELDRVAD